MLSHLSLMRYKLVFLFLLYICFLSCKGASICPPGRVNLRLNGFDAELAASNRPEAASLARKFVTDYGLEGGGCTVLPTMERRHECMVGLISQALSEDLIRGAFIAWAENGTYNCGTFDFGGFFQGRGYTRKDEMTIRTVAAEPDILNASMSLLSHLSDMGHELARLTLLDVSFELAGRAPFDVISYEDIVTSPEPRWKMLNSSTPNICAVTVATHDRGGLRRLNASAIANGMTLLVLGLGSAWSGHGQKVVLLRDFLASSASLPCDLVLFLDAFDTLLTAGAGAHLVHRFLSFGTGVVFNGEKAMAPDRALAASTPPLQRGAPLPYLNSGVFIGHRASVAALVEYALEDAAAAFGLEGAMALKADDQRLYQRALLRRPGLGRVDTAGLIFHSLHDAEPSHFIVDRGRLGQGVVWAKETATAPLVIHGNGNGCDLFLWLSRALDADGYPPPIGGAWEIESPETMCQWPFNSH